MHDASFPRIWVASQDPTNGYEYKNNIKPITLIKLVLFGQPMHSIPVVIQA